MQVLVQVSVQVLVQVEFKSEGEVGDSLGGPYGPFQIIPLILKLPYSLIPHKVNHEYYPQIDHVACMMSK